MRIERSAQGITLHRETRGFNFTLQSVPKSTYLNFATRSIVLKYSNGKTSTHKFQDVKTIRPFYRNPPEDDTEQSTGLCIDLTTQTTIPLDSGYLTFKEATDLAIELTEHLGLPTKPPYEGTSSKNFENSNSRILEQTSNRLVYRLDYTKAVLIIYLAIGVFMGIILGIPFISALHSNTPEGRWSAFAIAAVYFFGMTTLIQTIGFAEIWSFDRTTRQFQISRKRLFGQKTEKFPSRGITSVNLRTAVPSEINALESYSIGLATSTLDLKKGNTRDRIIYSNSDLQAATELADRLRHYLHINT
jgi:hypothetical protein